MSDTGKEDAPLNPTMNFKAISGLVVLAATGFFLFKTFTVTQDVAEEQVRQYKITLEEGSKMDICAHAGLVAAAYLQAEDQQNYRDWKATETSKCAEAGLPAM